jgi:hypothetical protein
MHTGQSKMLLIATLFLASLSVQSCSDSDPGNDGTPHQYAVVGHVEKGPFVRGSSISVQPLNASLTAVGTIFNGEITDDKGSFDIGTIELSSPYARLTGDGYFFNEVQGSLSSGTIKLNAIVDLANSSTVNVNLLTHLKAARIQTLVHDGKSYNDANSQAQRELLTQFGLQRFVDTDFSQVTISDGSDAAAALIAISSLILADRSEAEMTQYISNLSNQLAESGAFSAETFSEMEDDKDYISDKLNVIPQNIINRYQNLGQTVEVKNIALFIDWDGDGVAGNEVSDNPEITFSQDSVHFPKDGGEVTITVSSNIALWLTPRVNYPNDVGIGSSYGDFFTIESLSMETSFEDGKLTIKGGANKSVVSRSRNVELYDVFSKVQATIPVVWDADPTYTPTLSATGENFLSYFQEPLANAVSLDRYLDLAYCGINTGYNFAAPLLASNGDLTTLWNNDYRTIGLACEMINGLADNSYESYANVMSTYLAILYTPMMDKWGDLPLLTPENRGSYIIQLERSYKAAIQNYLIEYLQKTVNACADGKYSNEYKCADLIKLTKDVPYLALADVYMQQGNYADAFTYLNKVASSGHYSLNNSLTFNTSNKEIIFGLTDSSDATKVQPVYTLSDVYLKMAECKCHLGDETTAKTYVNKVVAAHDALSATSGTVIDRINAIRKQTRLPQYFAFLKRNNLAVTQLNLQNYQLLWPIPSDELMLNSACDQNPGY